MMDACVYECEHRVEQTHWWFVNRRKLFASEITRMGLAPDCKVLDIGTSTGTNLRMLQDMGLPNVTGLDSSEDAIRFCMEKGLGPVIHGSVTDMPFTDASFDLVLATDILEHLGAPTQGVREITRVLKPGGKALITVPAFQCLWGLQDEISKHKKRYTKHELLSLLQKNSSYLDINDCYYFNYILFLPIFFGRKIIRFLLKHNLTSIKSEGEVTSPILNTLLSPVFFFDIMTARRFKIPFGVSILAAVTRKSF